MSLDKGNVVIDLKDKNSLKEDEKKKIKGNEASDEQLDDFNFEEFDKVIEKSFQDFLKDLQIRQSDDKESIQQFFNEWLDKQCETLDIMKESAIEQKIIGPVSFELAKDATRVELMDLQQELLKNEKIKTEKDVNLKVGKEELKGLEKTYNGVKPEDIAVLFSQNFEGREHLLDLLKNKESRNDNIRKFQRIVAGIDETNNNKDKNSETLKKLGGTGVDGFFGKYTLEAFRKYVSDKKIVGENPVETEVTGNNPGGTVVSGENPGEDEVVVSASASVTGTAIQEPVRGNSVDKPKDTTSTPNATQPEQKIDESNQVVETKEKQQEPQEPQKGKSDTQPNEWNGNTSNNGETQGTTSGEATEATSGTAQNVDVQYKTSQTMSKENYERRNENAKHEKDAIKKLLGKGFLGIFSGKATEDISVGQKGYKIKLRSEEYNNLNKLYGVLNEFQEQNDKNYTLIDYFDVIFNKYQSGQTSFSGSKDLMILNKKDNDRYIQPKGFLINKYEDLGNLYVLYRQGQGGQYFNKVMGVLENYFLRGGISIEDINNGISFTKIFEENNYGVAKGGVDLDKLNINFDNDNKSKDKIRYNEKGEKEFMAMLSDFNLDGRLDHNDRGYYMGLELDNIYRSVNIDLKNSELSEQVESGQSVWKNIVNFAIDYFENLGDTDTANELKSVSTIDDLNTKLKVKKGDEGYKTLKSLQTMLKDSPVPISFICKYGNKAQEMFLNEVMMDKKFDEMYDAAFAELVKQGVNPELRIGLKPAIYASYINGGIGGGFGAAYDTKNIGTLSMSLGVTHVPGSEDLQYGIVLGRSQKEGFNVGSGKIKFGVDAGYSTQGFLALGKADFVSGIANKRQLEAMNADSVKRVNIGVSAGWLGNGLYASLKGGMSYDYIEGTINKYNELNNYLRESLTKIFDDEKFKTFFKDGKIDTSKGEEIKGFLREKLGEAGEKNEEVVNAAVENIYSGLIYFSAGLNLDESNEEAFNIAKNRIIYQLSETYTNKYISEHIDNNLDGELKLTNRSVGPAIFFNGNWAESIAKSVYYSVVGGLGFTRYGNKYMTETDQSKASYESRLSSGLGLDYLEGSVDKDGNITKETINYLNDKLSIIGNYDIEQMGIRFESMDNSSTKNIIYIPKDLFRGGVNIYLDKSLENFVESDEKGFKIPTNTEIALLTRSRTNSTQFDLVIGNYKKESDAISLSYNSELEGKPTEYKGKEKETGKTFNLDKLNNDMGKLYQREDFPLSTCEKTTDGKLVFVLENGKKISVEDKTLLDSNGNIVVSNYGKLLITKDNNGEYKASFKKGDKEQLMVTYDDGSKISVPLIGSDGSDGIDMGEIYGNNFATLNQSFKNFENALSKIDDGKWSQYVAFMNETCDLDDDIVNMDDYRKAFEKVKKMLDSSSDSSLSDIRALVDAITLDEQKVFVVDKFKMIFSLERRTSTVSGLKELAKRRSTKYENLKGYATAKENFPLKGLGYREKLINELGNGNVERIYDENLVGMTAFYRRGRESTGGRLVSTQLDDALGYSMTEIGSTDYIGKLLSITDNLEDTQNWFIENLKKTEVHKNILKKIIGKKTKLEITDEQLYELLRGNEINIDNSSKKIKINVDYVFYLLGECANESIGIKLGDIEISGGGQDGNGDNVIIDAETSYQGISGVYSGNVEAANRTVIQKVAQFGGSAIVGLGGGEPEPDDHTDPVDPDPEPDPDVTTDPYS